MPLRSPVALNERPGGRVEDAGTPHAYGVVPPIAASWVEYAVPTAPFGSVAALTMKTGLEVISGTNCVK